ncbi:LOW QUALITY PROTEIN: hypothetical protein CVT25_010438 [Psilocybe cyanescens]|uniref:DUF6589 domain-containing protein n=1 Tax=Psilocybe cyanescens TaxID=93625 RepID=A0A409XNV8_PSICY|nr:LOW QUALITY PROTEIN: hypothetical protein CVT25_010438 [Psilocybe cyanescens]
MVAVGNVLGHSTVHPKYLDAVANEFWGKPNSKSPWSLWKINTVLGCKAVCTGWTSKLPPPFRPMWELILGLSLPANILDAFCILCPENSLELWIQKVQSADNVVYVACKIHDELCSGRRVQQLRCAALVRRDIPLENIILFNCDALHLQQLKYAIKRGDVGAVLDLITHIMLAFWGTGQTPKYADALFHIVVNLKQMHPKLRHAWLFNWLANLSGKPNGFKEMDLLQEHQNFWLKDGSNQSHKKDSLCHAKQWPSSQVIYGAKGANRTWAWLSMVSVSTFALCDVICKEFVMPFNSIHHASPSTFTDIQVIHDYLQSQRLQQQKYATSLKLGLNVPTNRGHFETSSTPNSRPKIMVDVADVEEEHESSNKDSDELESCNIDAGSNLYADLDDLLLDEEECPEGLDSAEVFSMVNEVIDKLCGMD